MKVFVTRHGQTSWNALGKIQGKTDIELNETGKNQARETGEAINGNIKRGIKNYTIGCYNCFWYNQVYRKV